jgi:mandelate racemase
MQSQQKLTIESIGVRAVSIPMRRPIVSNVGSYAEWPLMLIDVKTKEGIIGRSYLEMYLKDAGRYIGPMILDLAETFMGSQVAPVDFYQESMGRLHLLGRQGLTLIASAGIDMAMWDILAKAAGLPLAKLLGGSVGPVRAYNTNGLWLIPLDRLTREAEELLVEGGFKGIKVRLGRKTLGDDLEAIRLVREAIGDDIALMCDFNQGLKLDEALLRCHGLDEQGLYWFEEPVVFDNFAQSAQLARELRTPVQIGENIYGPRSFFEAVQAQAADFYMPDLMRIGGVTGWMRAAALAGASGHPMSNHLYPEVSAHLLRVTETAHWLEWRDWANPIIAEPFEVKDGFIQVPDRPGNGIAWNEEAVRRYAYWG